MNLEHHMRKFAHAYENGILKPEKHNRLVTNSKQYAEAAGIKQSDIWLDPRGIINKVEWKWLTTWPTHKDNNLAGLVYFGEFTPNVRIRMAAAAGAFLRNSWDARVISLTSLVAEFFNSHTFPENRILLIPSIPAKMTENTAQNLEAMISDRFGIGQSTVLGFQEPTIEGSGIRGDSLVILRDHYTPAR